MVTTPFSPRMFGEMIQFDGCILSSDGLIHNHLARCWVGTNFYILHPWTFTQSKRKIVWTEPTFVFGASTCGIFQGYIVSFLMVLPLLDQQKASIFLKSPKKITNRRHGDRYVLWHNPWQVWAQKPLIGSSSQSGLGVERYHEWRSKKRCLYL